MKLRWRLVRVTGEGCHYRAKHRNDLYNLEVSITLQSVNATLSRCASNASEHIKTYQFSRDNPPCGKGYVQILYFLKREAEKEIITPLDHLAILLA